MIVKSLTTKITSFTDTGKPVRIKKFDYGKYLGDFILSSPYRG
jgi:hypothetical protein